MTLLKRNKKYIAAALVTLTAAGYAGGISYANNETYDSDLQNNKSNASINSRAANIGGSIRFGVGGVMFNAHAEAHKIGSNFRPLVEMTSTSNMPAGRMAVSASVYNGSGEVIHSTGYKYNTSSTTYISAVSNRQMSASQRYYAGGYARVKTSSGGYVDKKLSNVVSPKMAISSDLEKERQELYENYKMIPAVALNGESGYISEDDLLGEAPKSPEEAISIQESRKADDFKIIPVYNKDAKTIIGEFRIDL